MRIRHSSNKGVDWTKGMNQLKAEIGKANKSKSLMNISRWSRLIHGIVRLADSRANMNYEIATPSVVNMTANSSVMGSDRRRKGPRMSKKVVNRWRILTEGLLFRYQNDFYAQVYQVYGNRKPVGGYRMS